MTDVPERSEIEPINFKLAETTHSVSRDDSGDEDNEKLARDKLKKTSLASLSQDAAGAMMIGQTTEQAARIDGSTENLTEIFELARQPRGRPVRKRSLDHSESPARDISTSLVNQSDLSVEHARKRSRDVRLVEPIQAEKHLPDTLHHVVREEVEDCATVNNDEALSENHDPQDTMTSGENSANDHPLTVSENDIHIPTIDSRDRVTEIPIPVIDASKETSYPLESGPYSPRKKRSRDSLEHEIIREQKIAATDETRASRRSDEIDRGDIHPQRAFDFARAQPENSTNAGATDELQKMVRDKSKSSVVLPEAVFGTPSRFQQSRNTPNRSDLSGNSNDNSPAKSRAISPSLPMGENISVSPFATLAGPPSNSDSAIFASSKPTVATVKTSEQPNLPTLTSNTHSFSAAASSASPFATASLLTGIGSGKRPFGSAFEGGSGKGSRLTSFAAPAGDAKLGHLDTSVKPRGQNAQQQEDGPYSETECSDFEEQGKEQNDGDAVDERFQHQAVDTGEDGEETVFSSRASLYAFKCGSWKESGKGTFKLNVTESVSTAEKTGRFIMRAHQTYRVLLNAPIIAQMKVGDSRGDEPLAKSFAFAVVEDGRPTPYMVKLSDVHESQALYHKVRALQQDKP